MKDFGYKPLKSNAIDIFNANNSTWKEILELHPEMKSCISCGACAAVCPLNSGDSKLSVRRTIIELNRGIDISSAWKKCQMCNRCALVCPRGLNTRSIFFHLQQMPINTDNR